MQRALNRAAYGISIAIASLAMRYPSTFAQTVPNTAGQSQIVEGKRALAAKQFGEAKNIFAVAAKLHPDDLEASLGLADAELGLHQYEAAELGYRKVVEAQPELWQAHKNLVIVEAALGRWQEFDRERALLRMARQRGAPGISTRESDVIDGFTVHGQRWIVREYFEPAGRSLTRYNFENFSPNGKAQEYISLESNEAANVVVPGGSVKIGDAKPPTTTGPDFALNWYNGKGHGTIAHYGHHEPDYERVRADLLKWLHEQK
jgi:tetratricopeptide (TPR) repeat protein